jgi:hypothetical protein
MAIYNVHARPDITGIQQMEFVLLWLTTTQQTVQEIQFMHVIQQLDYIARQQQILAHVSRI